LFRSVSDATCSYEHDICLSVRPSVCNVGGLRSHGATKSENQYVTGRSLQAEADPDRSILWSRILLGKTSWVWGKCAGVLHFGGMCKRPGTRNAELFWILMKQEMTGWQWHQLHHYVKSNHLHFTPDR